MNGAVECRVGIGGDVGEDSIAFTFYGPKQHGFPLVPQHSPVLVLAAYIGFIYFHRTLD